MKFTEHRPWSLPVGPWIQAQSWNDLLFAHWPIPAEVMRQAIPASLELDTFDGSAWLGIVPFGISDFRARLLPPLPGLSGFLEINLRTYVTLGGKPGVYFFSLDAAHRLAVIGARLTYHLPYFYARINWQHEGDWIAYTSHRLSIPSADFSGRYRPTGVPQFPVKGSIDHWLTERYCLYAVGPHGQIYRGEIHHAPWPLQPAELVIETNTLSSRFSLPDIPPLLHFSRRQDVFIWPPVRA